MEQKEVLVTLKAIEFMSYGIDISRFTTVDEFKGYVNSNTKQYISRLSPTVTDFIWELEEDVQKFLSLYSPFVVRHEKSFTNLTRDDEDNVELLGEKPVNIVVTWDILLATIQQLYKQGICQYNSVEQTLLDPELLSRLEKIDKEFDRTIPPDNEMVKALSKDSIKKNFEILTSVAYQNCPEIRDKMLDAFNVKRKSFDIKGLEKFPVIDERIYIALSEADIYRIKEKLKQQGYRYPDTYKDMKYIVVSKNLYDYYFCSYGSEFQSCYSLTSAHLGWYGMLPMGIVEGHYIIYGTKDKPNKTAILGDNHKWATPHMYFRCWGWTAQDSSLLVDKAYTNQPEVYKVIQEVVLSKFMKVNVDRFTTLKNSDEFVELFSKYKLKFYPDSVCTETFKFKLSGGDRAFKGKLYPNYDGCSDKPVSQVLALIESVKDSFNPHKPIAIVNGVLVNPKVCPVTKLVIDESESQSKYAKYLNNPIKGHFAVVTYCDGAFKCDVKNFEGSSYDGTIQIVKGHGCVNGNTIQIGSMFQNTNNYRVSLKTFKEKLKGGIQTSSLSLILLRVIEDDKVTYIKYKQQGVNA